MMKKILYVLIAVLFVSCDDFLDTDSNDLIIPEFVDQYSELLFGEAHIKDNIMGELDMMSDDVQAHYDEWIPGNDGIAEYFGYYAWQQEPEYNAEGVLINDKMWPRLYKSIVICNTIINDYQDIKGDINEKEYLKAEAHFLRALDYFLLVNIYAPHYSAENLSKGGVPINDLSIVENTTYTRNTVGEVYDHIISDLQESEKLMETATYTHSIFKLNKASLYQLFSRVYLHMKEYDKVITYANLSIQENNSLVDLTTKTPIAWPDIAVMSQMNDEVNFSYLSVGRDDISPRQYKQSLIASDELISLYPTNDSRLSHYFFEAGFAPVVKYTSKTLNKLKFGLDFRVAEVYLNRAEAYAETNQVSKCLEDLNTLRSKRIPENYELSTTSNLDAIEYARNERRRELCFECNRWFDLKRWGQPSFSHDVTNEDGSVSTYVLNEYDQAYIMPLPNNTKKLNPNMDDYPNPIRTPQNN